MSEVVVASTHLVDYALCPRRFELLHLLGLRDRAPSIRKTANRETKNPTDATTAQSARDEGVLLHAVLEHIDLRWLGHDDPAQGVERALIHHGIDPSHPRFSVLEQRIAQFLRSDYAREVAHTRATVLREEAFAVPVRGPSPDGTIWVRGSIDMIVRWPSGNVDIVDYKSSLAGSSNERYRVQLSAYRAAILHREGSGVLVRTGLVSLSEGEAEPRWLVADVDIFEYAARLVRSRLASRFNLIAPSGCRAISCGFVTYCHEGSHGAQTTFVKE